MDDPRQHPNRHRLFSEIPLYEEFTRKVGSQKVRMLKDGKKTARMFKDVPDLLSGRAAPVYRVPADELMLD